MMKVKTNGKSNYIGKGIIGEVREKNSKTNLVLFYPEQMNPCYRIWIEANSVEEI